MNTAKKEVRIHPHVGMWVSKDGSEVTERQLQQCKKSTGGFV